MPCQDCDNCNGRPDARPVYLACDPFSILGDAFINNFEGLVLQPLCDDTTGDVVGYFAVTRSETDPPTFTTVYFDTNGAEIPVPPANSKVCIPIDEDYEPHVLCDFEGDTITPFMRHFVRDNGGAVTFNDTQFDGVTPYIVTNENNVTTCPPTQKVLIAGYILECDRFDLSLPVISEADFQDNGVGDNSISIASASVAALIREVVENAISVEEEEIKHSLPVTPVIITTRTGEIFSFNPSALQGGTGGTLIITDAGVVSWGLNGTHEMIQIQYSELGSCDCRPIEVLQECLPNNTVRVLSVLDPSNYDPLTGIKPDISNGGGLLDFGTLGVFIAPCPEDPQVLEVNPLCCNNDLLNTHPEIVNLIDAWADAATDLVNLLDATTGLPIAGNSGDRVGEVLNPKGAGLSWDVQGAIPPPIPNGGFRYEPNTYNGLPSFQFDGAPYPSPTNSGEHMEILTGIAKGTPFQLFFLAAFPSTTDSSIIVGGDVPFNGREDWQLQFSSTLNDMHFRWRGQTYTAGITDIPFATHAELTDGQPHLITVDYEGSTTDNVNIYVDGEFRITINVVTDNQQIPNDPCLLESGLIGLMRNAGDDGYAQGNIMEVIFAGTSFTPEQIALTNAYLICKWGIDPSLAVGGSGDLVLVDTEYTGVTPFVQRILADGNVVYTNTLNGQQFPLPPLPDLTLCADKNTIVEIAGRTVQTIMEIVAAVAYQITPDDDLVGWSVMSIGDDPVAVTVNGSVTNLEPNHTLGVQVDPENLLGDTVVINSAGATEIARVIEVRRI